MPWKVQKRGNKWVIIKTTTGEVVGKSDTRAMAMASLRARYHSEAGGKFTRRK